MQTNRLSLDNQASKDTVRLDVSATSRTDFARQRSCISFGRTKVDAERLHRTERGGQPVVLDSPTSSEEELNSDSSPVTRSTRAASDGSITPIDSSVTHEPVKRKKNVSFQAVPTEDECTHDRDSASLPSPIHAVCCNGDHLVLKHLLSFYFGNECFNLVNSTCVCGMTPLEVACANGHVKVARLLLRRHAQPNRAGKRARSCIAMACASQNASLVELLVRYGAVVDEETLLTSCRIGLEDVVKALVVSTGASEPRLLYTGASVAVEHKHKRIVPLLLGDGVDVTSQRHVQACALDAASRGDRKLLRAIASLYDAKVVLAAKDSESRTLLHHAAQKLCTKSVDMLIAMGADVNARDRRGISPLYVACARGQSCIVQCLVSAGAEVVAMGPNDETPLHMAAQENHLRCVEILLKQAKAPVDGVTRDFCTALHLASQRGNTQVVECLLSRGAYVDALTVGNETPLLKASRMSQTRTVKLLLASNANPQLMCASAAGLKDLMVRGEEQDEQIFIAKSNTHTSLKQWLTSIVKQKK